MTTHNTAIIWGQKGCSACNNAWDLLDSKGYSIDYRIIGDGWTKEDFLASNPGRRSVPQIWIDKEYVGDYLDLVDYFK